MDLATMEYIEINAFGIVLLLSMLALILKSHMHARDAFLGSFIGLLIVNIVALSTDTGVFYSRDLATSCSALSTRSSAPRSSSARWHSAICGCAIAFNVFSPDTAFPPR